MGVLGSRNLGFCRYRVTDRFPFLGYQSIRFKAYWGGSTAQVPRYLSEVNDGSGHFMVLGAPDTRKKNSVCYGHRCLLHHVSHIRLRSQGYAFGLPSVLLIQHGPFLGLQRRVDFHNQSEMRGRQ